MRTFLLVLLLTGITGLSQSATSAEIELGPRPYYLVDQLPKGALKDKLKSCSAMPSVKSDFSIGHRGAPLQFPEHTERSYRAAARMGAGIIECDVTFTSDKELVCRHSQNDLHTTTNILATDLAIKCSQGFTPATGSEPASAQCRTSDITLAEFTTLRGKMDGVNRQAKDVANYLNGTAKWRTDLYGQTGKVMTHAQSIALFKELGVKFTPELKSPVVAMPYKGFSQKNYAQKLIDEYKAAGVDPKDVWAQSFNLDDIVYWIKNEPEFGAQAVFLDGRARGGLDPNNVATFKPSMAELKAKGVNYIAPPMWMLVTLDGGKIVPSAYATEAKAAGLKLITWTLERSGPLTKGGGGWYYRSIQSAVTGDGSVYELLHVLAQDADIEAIFSDWPATVTYYANCMGLR